MSRVRANRIAVRLVALLVAGVELRALIATIVHAFRHAPAAPIHGLAAAGTWELALLAYALALMVRETGRGLPAALVAAALAACQPLAGGHPILAIGGLHHELGAITPALLQLGAGISLAVLTFRYAGQLLAKLVPDPAAPPASTPQLPPGRRRTRIRTSRPLPLVAGSSLRGPPRARVISAI